MLGLAVFGLFVELLADVIRKLGFYTIRHRNFDVNDYNAVILVQCYDTRFLGLSYMIIYYSSWS